MGSFVVVWVLLATLAVAEDLSGWTVSETRDPPPASCREWDRRRDGRWRVLCPPGVAVSGLIVHSDVGAALSAERRRSPRQENFFGAFRTLAEIDVQLERYRVASPSLSLEVLGRTSGGRNITLVKIAAAPNLPIVFLTGGLHAREWLSPMTLMYTVDFLRGAVALPQSPVAAFEWHVVVVSNPDGYEYSWSGQRYWRKNRAPSSISTCVGVDLNRNFDDHWGFSGSSTDPCTEIYQGTSAGSELETQALQTHMRAVGRRGLAYVDVHTYGPTWTSIYGYAINLYPPNYETLHRAMVAAQSAAHAVNGLRFEIGTDAGGVYASSGGSDDYAYIQAGFTGGFTVELRGNDFVVPADYILLSGPEFKEGLVAMVLQLKQEVITTGSTSTTATTTSTTATTTTTSVPSTEAPPTSTISFSTAVGTTLSESPSTVQSTTTTSSPSLSPAPISTTTLLTSASSSTAALTTTTSPLPDGAALVFFIAVVAIIFVIAVVMFIYFWRKRRAGRNNVEMVANVTVTEDAEQELGVKAPPAMDVLVSEDDKTPEDFL